jgi:cell division protein FtsQ
VAKPRNERKAEPAEGFWDKPVLMNLVSDLLVVLGCALLAWAAAMSLQRLPIAPLREVVVTAPVERVSQSQIEHAARSALSGNFFTANLDAARAAFEKLPWVRRADVRRRWPDGIELEIEEHVAVARWQRADGEARLVNSHGELFSAAPPEIALPVFSAPESASALVLGRYREFAQALAALGRQPVAVTVTAREAWQLRLDDGVVVELGRDEAKHPLGERMARFVGHYPQARARLGQAAAGVADMRYPNGFALRAARRNS